MKKFLIITLFLTLGLADCVIGAKDKMYFVVLDNHTLVLKGGLGNDILIKTYCNVSPYSKIQMLKDDFCDYDDSVLYINGEVCDVQQVKNLY